MNLRPDPTPLVVLSLLAAAGCAGPQAEPRSEEAPAAWSTKEQPTPRDPRFAAIRVDAPARPADPQAVRRQAVALLVQAADSTNELLRANALEALAPAHDALQPAVRLGLSDESRGVRFVAAMLVGHERLVDLAHLCEPLLDDTSDSVRAAAIFALSRCGRTVSLAPLAEMLASHDPEVKANAAIVLGELGNRTAIPMLREAMRSPMARATPLRNRIVELQIAEAIVRLGDESELEAIRATLFVPAEQGELAALACQIEGELHDEAYSAALYDKATREGRDAEPAEIRLAAAAALARIDPVNAPIHVPLAYVSSDDFLIRAQAAMTLGWFADEGSLAMLGTLMRDPNAMVQVAAAGGVLRRVR